MKWENILGGKTNTETEHRIERFGKELEAKRNYDKFTVFDSKANQMVVMTKIRVFSFCSHHLLPYFGECSIGYIPNGKILGLSKFQRIVDKCASKPTVQEELTQDIVDTLNGLLNAKGFGCVVKCQHTCAMGRGVLSGITMNTQVMSGKFNESMVRQEFLSRI